MLTTVVKDNSAYPGIRVIKIRKVENGNTIVPRVVISDIEANDNIRSLIPIPNTDGNKEMKKWFDKSVHDVWRDYGNQKVIWPLPKKYIFNLVSNNS